MFVYLKMGGAKNSMLIKMLDKNDRQLFKQLKTFNAADARCFLDDDRQRLLAVIETGFGSFAPFNAVVRGIFEHQRRMSETKNIAEQVAQMNAQKPMGNLEA